MIQGKWKIEKIKLFFTGFLFIISIIISVQFSPFNYSTTDIHEYFIVYYESEIKAPAFLIIGINLKTKII
jgi:hypothetical protein